MPGEGVLVGAGPAASADRIVDLLRSEAKRRALGEAGRLFVERQQTWELAADRLEAAYEQALGRGDGRGES